jgi:cytidyltransferase-like protein
MKRKRKKVFVSGCFDMLHSGHVAFLKEAASYGDVYVGIGTDENVRNLKGRYPVNSQEERRYMLGSLRCVTGCVINKGWGYIDFEQELREIAPDMLIVNEDGNTAAKARMCKKLDIKYVILRRIPAQDLPARSTTALRNECTMPYRIDLAGGWLDQPYVGRFGCGPVITISIEPTVEFNERSGMATSTRRKAIELWHTDVPSGDRERLAKVLFSYENPPGKKEIAGSQDALGIVLPGLNKLHYEGDYWPSRITSIHEESVLRWLEEHLSLVTLGPRESGFTVVDDADIREEKVRALARAAEGCWRAIRQKKLREFGKFFKDSFSAQVSIFPRMVDLDIEQTIDEYKNKAVGWKLSGAGGGGYLICVTEEKIKGAMNIRIRRRGTQ